MAFTRQLAAIMFTDIQGYTRLMQINEEQAISMRNKHRKIFDHQTDVYGGEILQYWGDGTLSIFKSTIEAVNCACKMQELFLQDPKVPVRIGIHTGDIMKQDKEIMGDSVNLASRIESLGVPGSILISEQVAEEVKNQKELKTALIGDFLLKNVSKPTRIYAIDLPYLTIPKEKEITGKLEKTKKGLFQSKIVRSIMAMLTLLAITIIAIFYGRETLTRPIDSVAVLPFIDRMNDLEKIHIIEGVHDELISKLQEAGVAVKPRTSMLQYKNSTKSVKQIAQELNVNALIEGAIILDGNDLSLDVRMIDGKSEEYIWDNQYDSNLRNIMSVYNEFTLNIAQEIQLALSPEVVYGLANHQEVDPEAYDLYLLGKYHTNLGSHQDIELAIGYFLESLEIDSEFGPAHTGLVECYLLQGFSTAQPMVAYAKFSAHAERALSLDKGIVYNHHLMAMLKIFTEWDWVGAEKELKKAVEADPSWSTYDSYCQFLWAMGRTEESVAAGNRAVSADPTAHFAHCDLAWALYYNDQIEEARQEIIYTIDSFGTNCPYHMGLHWILELESIDETTAKLDSVVNEFEIWLDSKSEFEYAFTYLLSFAYSKAGDEDKLHTLLEKMNQETEVYIDPVLKADVCMGLKDYERALDLLEEAFGQRSFLLLYVIKVSKNLDPIRENPRFKKLLRNMNLDTT